jgi:nicotinate-nucleotide adenylyltransferase
MIIANYMAEVTDMDEVWFMVTPQNPFKKKESLLDEYDRLHLVELAIAGNSQLKASNFEFNLPRPSYTIDTLTHLKEKYNQHDFSLIMGGDNLKSLHKWKNYDKILQDHRIYVYKRAGAKGSELEEHPQVEVRDVPLLNISASFIRQTIKSGYSVRYLLPEPVYEYVTEMNLFK